MTQAAAPLYEGLLAYLKRDYAGFHTPGHGGRLADLSTLARLDLTEVSLWPGGPLTPALVREAEGLAAQLFGAGRSFFLTNGASIGVQAMLCGACPPGTEILVGRDCHRSVVSACILGDLRPIFLDPVTVTDWPSFPIGVDPRGVADRLAPNQPVLLTNPTYQGVVWDLTPLAGTRRNGLLVDEAHGAHLALDSRQKGASAAGAMAWVHGTHKTLGSLTQTGILHLAPGTPWEATAAWLDRLASTSPSYPLAASLDLARRWAARDGKTRWAAAADRMARLRREMDRAGLRVLNETHLPPGAGVDPAKLTVAAPAGGFAAARRLQELFGIQAEAAGFDWLTFIVTPFHTDDELARLNTALSAMAAEKGRRDTVPRWPEGQPPRVLWPREASLRNRRWVPLPEAAGRVAADPLCPYPPGIPLVWPGEVITEETLCFLSSTLAAGGTVTGVDAAGLAAVVSD